MSEETETKGPLPMKAPGCPWRFWGGFVGISEKLVAFDGALPVGVAKDLTPRARRALAAHMVELWQRFGSGEG